MENKLPVDISLVEKKVEGMVEIKGSCSEAQATEKEDEGAL